MPHGLPEIIAYGMLAVFSACLIIHGAHRVLRDPKITEPLTTNAKNDLAMFDGVQRLFHWGTTIGFAGILVSGFLLYDPFTFEPMTEALRIPLHTAFPLWVTLHVIFALILGALLVLHIAWDVARLHALQQMLPTRRDIRDATLRVRNFLSLAKDYPRMGKYDFFMKSFHLYLASSFIILAITGIFLYFQAPWWSFPWFLHHEIEPFWRPTVLHDVFGFVLTALVVGHVYFAVLRVNRPLLRAIFTGRLGRDEAQRRYRLESPEGG